MTRWRIVFEILLKERHINRWVVLTVAALEPETSTSTAMVAPSLAVLLTVTRTSVLGSKSMVAKVDLSERRSSQLEEGDLQLYQGKYGNERGQLRQCICEAFNKYPSNKRSDTVITLCRECTGLIVT